MALSALARHESGLRLLTQARQSAPAASTEVGALLKRLSQYFRHIVLDLGATRSPQLVKDVLHMPVKSGWSAAKALPAWCGPPS